MNRRKLIAMTPAERKRYVTEAKTIILCTHDPYGYPHAVAMWFHADDDGIIWMTTYRKAQKVLNIRRNPKVALLVESGTTYDALKGVLMRGDAELIDDEDTCVRLLTRIHEKMSGALPEGVDEAMRAQARKRVAIKVTPRRVASWDHSKLGGAY